jgi:tetratricopeptide (TPR) repeat protein
MSSLRPPAFRLLAAALLFLGALTCGACVDRAAEHRVRANAFLRGGDAAAALKEIDEGLAGAQGNVPLLILKGKALFELDKLDEAKAAYQGALDAGRAEEPKSLSEAHLGLAVIASRQKDWPNARKHFETLVGFNEKWDASSHLNLSRACLELGDMSCAVTHAEAAGHIRGNDEPVLFTLGKVYLAAGKPDEAQAAFSHICEVVPSASSCPYGLALVAARKGDKELALGHLREAVRRKLPNPDQLAQDPGFATLKDDPEFQKIAAQAVKP